MGRWLGEHGESYACQLGYPASPTFYQARLGLDFLSSIVLFPCRNVVDLSQACVVCQEELVCRGSFPVLFRLSCLCQTQAPDSPMLSFLSLSFNKSAFPVSVTHRKSKSFHSCSVFSDQQIISVSFISGDISFVPSSQAFLLSFLYLFEIVFLHENKCWLNQKNISGLMPCVKMNFTVITKSLILW